MAETDRERAERRRERLTEMLADVGREKKRLAAEEKVYRRAIWDLDNILREMDQEETHDEE